VWITSALLSLAAWAVPAAAQDDDYRRCEQYRESKRESNPDLALQYCSSAIQSNRLSAKQLVNALNGRGLAFSMKGDFEHAIQDFDQAVRLAPDDAEAHGWSTDGVFGLLSKASRQCASARWSGRSLGKCPASGRFILRTRHPASQRATPSPDRVEPRMLA
jgi:tetratricopeptide (TPR) repeat protein